MAEDGRFHRVRAELIEEDGAGGFRRTVQAGDVDGPGGLPEIPWHEIMGDGGRSGGAPCLVRGGRRSPDCGQAPADTPAEAVILSVPLITGSMVIGVLTVEAADAGGSDGEEAGLVVRLAGDLAFGIRSLRDREERRRMEDSLAQSRNSLAEAQALAHLGSWEYDLERDEENRSDEFFRILGLPPRGNGRANDSVFQYIHPGDLERVRNSLADTLERGKPYDIEYRIIRPDGTERTVHAQGKTLSDAKGRITRFIGTIQDITEAKRLERKYLQAQKMEAVGQLAGGIAHDFNNILTAVIGYQHLLLERLEDGKSRNLALQVMNLAEKATNLTGDLLAFSRKQPVNPKPIDLNETVGAIGEILRRLMGEEIEFRFTPLTGTLTVMAVASQIEQILMNLAMNARDAMPDGGILAIATGIEPPDRQHSWIEGPDKADAYAMISVADNGTGMDEKTQKRIFEPFFTTKGEGKGTGLGLSTVYGIVRQHGGEITVHSTPGKGTTFRVYLPLIVAEIPDTIARGERIPTTGCETVLVAEDDHELRKLMCSLLEKEGYRVLAAPDGEQALDLYSAHGSGIDIVILDVIMPKRSGREVYDIIGRAGRDVKTIFISGYSVDIIESKGIPDCCQVLGKPFSPLAFLVAVREALNAT
jgi:PAS domain S-box-containing protein